MKTLFTLAILASLVHPASSQAVPAHKPLPKVVVMPKPGPAVKMFTPKPVAVSMPKAPPPPAIVKTVKVAEVAGK